LTELRQVQRQSYGQIIFPVDAAGLRLVEIARPDGLFGYSTVDRNAIFFAFGRRWGYELPAALANALSHTMAGAVIVLAAIVCAAMVLGGPADTLSIVASIQDNLKQKNYYDGKVDGIVGVHTRAALREFEKDSGVDLTDKALPAVLAALRGSKVEASSKVKTTDSFSSSIAHRDTLSFAEKQIPQRSTLPPSGEADPQFDPIREIISRREKGLEDVTKEETDLSRMTAIQRALSEFGYGQIRLSGSLDERTSEAIKKFEVEHGMPVTGRPSDRLIHELSAMIGRPLQ
jgi:peptidoglycan hydrolase-like protein with peptidoglycan-binding domain